jgi:hypothetical protein
VKLYYDPEWLKILKYTQKMIPLTGAKYDFRFLDRSKPEVIKEISEIKIEDEELSIPCIDEDVYIVKYNKVHP